VQGVADMMAKERATAFRKGDIVAVMTIDKFGRPISKGMAEIWDVRSTMYVIKILPNCAQVPIYYTRATLHAAMARADYLPGYCRKTKTPEYWIAKL